MDELASGQDTFVSNFDKFKSMMTGPFLNINPKGVNQFSIKNVMAWFLISNHDDCLRVEPSDRRYFCLSVSEKYTGNKEYFKRLADTFNDSTGNIFYSFVMNRGDSRDVNIRIPPTNPFKKTLITHSWSSSIKYLFDVKNDRLADEPNDEPDEVCPMDFYDRYKFWCQSNGERAKSKVKFLKDIADHITKRHTRESNLYNLRSVRL